jgi:hypothetical protein
MAVKTFHIELRNPDTFAIPGEWRHAIQVILHEGERPITNIPKARRNINDWLEQNQIVYKYSTGLTWYLNDDEAVTMLMLKWG